MRCSTTRIMPPVQRPHLGLIVLLALVAGEMLLGRVVAAEIVLYDGASNQPPNSPAWNWTVSEDGGTLVTPAASVIRTTSGGLTNLDTLNPESDRAGYGKLLAPAVNLDRATGYTFRFEMQVLSEVHTSNDRAGFSILHTTSDGRGLELGFWMDQVWAQNDSPLFTHGEEQPLDSTDRQLYTLTVLNDSYSLSSPGMATLTGPLRDYSSFGLPYTLPNFLFFGDNTTSGEALARIAYVGVTVVPEPAVILLALIGVFGCVIARRYQAGLTPTVSAARRAYPAASASHT
jgi:hypothetical protein